MQQIFKVTNVGAIEQITSKKDGSTTMQQRAEKANLVGAFATKREPSDDSRSVCDKRDPSDDSRSVCVKRDPIENDQVSWGTFDANVPTSGDKRRGKLSRSVPSQTRPIENDQVSEGTFDANVPTSWGTFGANVPTSGDNNPKMKRLRLVYSFFAYLCIRQSLPRNLKKHSTL